MLRSGSLRMQRTVAGLVTSAREFCGSTQANIQAFGDHTSAWYLKPKVGFSQ